MPASAFLKLEGVSDLDSADDLIAELIEPAPLYPASLEIAALLKSAGLHPADLARKLKAQLCAEALAKLDEVEIQTLIRPVG